MSEVIVKRIRNGETVELKSGNLTFIVFLDSNGEELTCRLKEEEIEKTGMSVIDLKGKKFKNLPIRAVVAEKRYTVSVTTGFCGVKTKLKVEKREIKRT